VERQNFSDEHEREGRQLLSIGCLYFVVFILAVLVFVFCIKGNSAVAAGSAVFAFVVWGWIKIKYGDEWNV
jgi:hypothetical protein